MFISVNFYKRKIRHTENNGKELNNVTDLGVPLHLYLPLYFVVTRYELEFSSDKSRSGNSYLSPLKSTKNPGRKVQLF